MTQPRADFPTVQRGFERAAGGCIDPLDWYAIGQIAIIYRLRRRQGDIVSAEPTIIP